MIDQEKTVSHASPESNAWLTIIKEVTWPMYSVYAIDRRDESFVYYRYFYATFIASLSI